jgi:hypothetical protein
MRMPRGVISGQTARRFTGGVTELEAIRRKLFASTQARTCQPGLKGLLITGYAEVLCTDGIPGIPVLPKPFKVAELSGMA